MRYIDKSNCKTVKERGVDRDLVQTRDLTRAATRIAEFLKLGLLKTRDGYYRVIRESGLGSPEHADAIFDTLAEVDAYLRSLAPDTANSTKRGVTSSYSGDGRSEDDLVNLEFRSALQRVRDALDEFENTYIDETDAWTEWIPQDTEKQVLRHIVAIRNIIDSNIDESVRQDLLSYE